jgi:hypothetical protein
MITLLKEKHSLLMPVRKAINNFGCGHQSTMAGLIMPLSCSPLVFLSDFIASLSLLCLHRIVNVNCRYKYQTATFLSPADNCPAQPSSSLLYRLNQKGYFRLNIRWVSRS